MKVHFVGAGPGAEDLITVRGQRLIQEADVIVYAGSLVPKALLKSARTDCEIYNSATMTMEEVTDVMVNAANVGRKVVRLHTGDPSIYGAIREQMDVLDANGIEYDVCPGVSACFGAAAAIGLEYTLPGISQSLIITRMEGRTPVPEKESIRSFAAHKASMAIYLSSGMTGRVAEELIAGGYEKTTPACIVYKATWPEEKVFYCTLETLEKVSEENGIKNTAMIIVGDVVGKTNCERSKLYSPDFETLFRKAVKK